MQRDTSAGRQCSHLRKRALELRTAQVCESCDKGEGLWSPYTTSILPFTIVCHVRIAAGYRSFKFAVAEVLEMQESLSPSEILPSSKIHSQSAHKWHLSQSMRLLQTEDQYVK